MPHIPQVLPICTTKIPLKVGAAAVSVLGTIATAALIGGKFRIIIEYTESVLA